MFLIFHVTSPNDFLNDHVALCLRALNTVHHTANFCGFKHFRSLICHLISKDHVFKRLCDFMGGTPQVSHQSVNFNCHRPCGREI